MNKKALWVVAGLLVIAMATPLMAQNEVKEKSPIYIYIGEWSIPRAQWADMEKSETADQSMLQSAMSAGTLVAYGSDVNLVHQPDGPTHDDWWVVDVDGRHPQHAGPVLQGRQQRVTCVEFGHQALGQHRRQPVLQLEARHLQGRLYPRLNLQVEGRRAERCSGLLAKSFLVPFMEKMMSEGAIVEYDIDTEAIHTEAPGTFLLFYTAPNAEGLDKVNQALQQMLKASPLDGPAFGSMIDFTAHRDYLSRTNATFK